MDKRLVEEAIAARDLAYTPYSHFQVGAALLTKDGQIIRGCNIENAAYGPTNCAERTAIFKAVSEGYKEFDAIAIVGGMEGAGVLELCPPCGVCRQVMKEFCQPDFTIILGKRNEDGVISYEKHSLAELLPLGFDL